MYGWVESICASEGAVTPTAALGLLGSSSELPVVVEPIEMTFCVVGKT